MKARYCKCKNTYTINNCDNSCNAQYYWAHGIGRITGIPIEEEIPTPCESVFDSTFDITFGCVTTEEGIFDNTFDITFN